MERHSQWPEPEKSYWAVNDVIRQAINEGRLGLDLEYNDEGPTIIGVASKQRCAAWAWSPELGNAAAHCGVPIAAHAGLGADRPVLEKALNIKTPLEQWNDTMLKHWCCNPDLSSGAKTKEDETDDAGMVMGLMNLWVTTSLLHDLPMWKRCIGEQQCIAERRPCPEHDPYAYCAVDSWTGLIDDYALDEQMSTLGIPQSYYSWRARIAEYCEAMQAKGIGVDTAVIQGLEAAINSRKATLFPCKLSYEGKPYKDGRPRVLKKPRKVWDGPFNPSSSKAVLAWFSANGINLHDRMGKPSIGKQVILKALEKALKPYGLKFDPRIGEVEGDFEGELPEVTDMLLRLCQKTIASKGTSSWFDEKYITNGEVHPRFNVCGTSTGRLSSSKPNCQNIPRVGFGAQVRKAIVAKPSFKIVKSDFSQLEFRICLWAAGVDPNVADGAFEMLVERSEGMFENAAARLSWKPRDVSKSAVHGSNYLEGLQIRNAKELDSSAALGDRRAGALLVYDGRDLPEWLFRGGFVCFTGGNLSERLFGNRTRENRAKALRIQQVYMDAFPQIRQFQQQVAREIEHSYEVRLPSGHRVALYGRTPEDDLKYAAALWGQGGGAIYAQEAMLNFADKGIICNLQIHDELVVEVPQDWNDSRCLDYMRPMVLPSRILTGFTCPANCAVGPNWKDTAELGTIRWQDRPCSQSDVLCDMGVPKK